MQQSSFEHWKDAIQKYIQDKSISDFEHKVGGGITFNPFAHHENTPDVVGLIPWPKSTSLGVSLSPASNNKSILKALEFGLQAFKLNVTSEVDLSGLLEGVNLEYLNTIFYTDNSESNTALSEYLKNKYPNTKLNDISCNHELLGSWGDSKMLVSAIKKDDPTDSLVEICNKIRSLGETPFTIEVNIGQKFFLEIARLRALRLLVANLSENKNFEIHTHISLSELDSDHSDYIKKTAALLSAYLGGSNVVFLGLLEDHLDNNTRLEMNIQHILQLESKLNNYQDPMGGSFFMEDLTRKVCENVWQKL